MAEEDKESKTEAATERRIRQANEEGQIPISKDVTSFASLLGGTLMLLLCVGRLRDSIYAMITEVLQNLPTTPFGNLGHSIAQPIVLCLAICTGVGFIAMMGGLLQTRGRIWPNLLAPNAQRLFQISKLTRLFKREFLTDLALSTVKVVAVGVTIWSVLRDEFMTLADLMNAPTTVLLPGLFAPLKKVALRGLFALGTLAAIEFAVTHYRFRERVKMTKQEVKRELKEDEGDPMMKGRRRKRARELAKGRAQIEVPRADALIVNPTHFAVAIRYRKTDARAPRVTAKGKDYLALMMKNLARENGVPIVEDIHLARLLYKKVKVGREIPADTYRAVAAILAFVYRLTGRNPNQMAGL